MAAAAHNPEFAKKMGIPVSVAKDFNQADKGKHFGSGGNVKKKHSMGKGPIAPQLPPQLDAAGAGAPMAAGPPGGMPGMPGMKHGGHTKKHHFAAGGETVKSEQGPLKKWPLKGEEKDHHGKKVAMKHGGKLHSRGGGAAKKGFASGGAVRGNGICERGHTRGTFR
jgi:hypothetical protein